MDFINDVDDYDLARGLNREYIDMWLDKPHAYMEGGIEVELLNAKGPSRELEDQFNSNDMQKAFNVKQGEFSIIGDARYHEMHNMSEADMHMDGRLVTGDDLETRARKTALVRRADSKGKFGYGANKDSLIEPPKGFEYAIEDWSVSERVAAALGKESSDAIPVSLSERLLDIIQVVESKGDYVVFAKDRSSLEELLSPHESFPTTSHGPGVRILDEGLDDEIRLTLPGGENYQEWAIRWNPGPKDRTGPNSMVEWDKDKTLSDAHLGNMRENRNNIIGHVRTKDYRVVNEAGEEQRVLAIMEGQSDWDAAFAQQKKGMEGDPSQYFSTDPQDLREVNFPEL